MRHELDNRIALELAALCRRICLNHSLKASPFWAFCGLCLGVAFALATDTALFVPLGLAIVLFVATASSWKACARRLSTAAATRTLLKRIDTAINAHDALLTHVEVKESAMAEVIATKLGALFDKHPQASCLPRVASGPLAPALALLLLALLALPLWPNLVEIQERANQWLASALPNQTASTSTRGQQQPSPKEGDGDTQHMGSGGGANTAGNNHDASASNNEGKRESSDSQKGTPSSQTHSKGTEHKPWLTSPDKNPRDPNQPSPSGSQESPNNVINNSIPRPSDPSAPPPNNKEGKKRDYKEREVRIRPIAGEGELKSTLVEKNVPDPEGGRSQKQPIRIGQGSAKSSQNPPQGLSRGMSASQQERQWLKKWIQKKSSSD